MSYNSECGKKGINEVRLGDYIRCSTENNRSLQYGYELIEGVTNDGIFSTPKIDPLSVDLKPYKVVENGAFVYNPSRLDIGSIAYRTEGLCIVSHLYVVFYLNEQGIKEVDPYYLLIYFRRKEFCREVSFRNFGSQRPEFSFCDMSNMVIPLPDITVQRRYAAIYRAMLDNQRVYERGLDDLKLVCEGYIENLKRIHSSEPIGKYLVLSEKRNEYGFGVGSVRGLSVSKEMIQTKADMDGVGLSNYKLVPPRHIAYVPDTSRRGDKVSLGYNSTEDTYLVSSISTVFATDEKHLLSDFLMLFFTRGEFDRYARFHSWGSARETFDWNEMCAVEIPIPDIKIQQYIVNIYIAYQLRKEINEQLKAQIKDICPILIKGSLEEAMAQGG